MIYRFSNWERAAYTGAFGAMALGMMLFLIFLPPDYLSWIFPLSTIVGAIGFLTLRQWFLTWQKVTFHDNHLTLSSLWKNHNIIFSDLRSWREDPGLGRLILVTSVRSYTISRRIRPYEKLRDRLSGILPQAGQNELPILLETVKSALAVYGLFVLGALSFFLIFLNFSPWTLISGLIVGFICGAVQISLVVRILWLVPVSYLLSNAGLEIRYLIRKKMVLPGQVEQIFSDTHAATGASFHLLRITLRDGSNVILDEMVLHQPLLRVEAFLNGVFNLSPTKN